MKRRRHIASLASALIALVCGVGHANDDPSQWRAIALGRSLEAADAITEPYRRAEALANIARAQAGIDDRRAADRTIEQALGAAREVREAEFRGWALHDVALAQIACEDLIGARETVAAIEADRPHGAVWAALAEIDVRRGDLDSAQAIAAKIRDAGSRSLVQRQVLAVRVSRGELESARAVLRAIDDPYYEAMARGDLASAEVRSGRIEQAHSLAARAPRKHRSEVYGRIALARLSRKDARGAFESALKITDVSVAAVTLAQLARMQSAGGDAAGARDTLHRARAEADQLPVGEERDDALDHIARELVRVGDSAAALDCALLLNDRIARALLVRDVVAMQRDATGSSAMAMAAKFDDPLTSAAALFGVLGAQLVREDPVGLKPDLRSDPKQLAQATIDAAREATEKIDAPLRPAAFAALAAASKRIGAGGEALFLEALNAAAALERAEQRSSAYLRIASAINDRLMFLGRPAAPAQK